MKVLQVLLLCFVSAAPWDRINSLTIHQKKEGTRFRIEFFFSSHKSLKFFCKNECLDGGDVLVKTEQNEHTSGRYRTEFQTRTSGGGVLSVTVLNLTKHDSGRYRFGVGGSLVPDFFRDFEIRVLNASEEEFNIHSRAEGSNVSVLCHFFSSRTTKVLCRNMCNAGEILLETTEDRARSDRYSITYEPAGAKFLLRVSVSELRVSDSGLYACGLGESVSSASFQRFEIRVTGASSSPARLGSFLPLLICLPVAVGLLAAVLLFLHRLRTKKSSEARNAEVTLLGVAYEHNQHSFHSYPDDFTVQEPETL